MGMSMTGSNGILSVPSEHLPGLIALILFPILAWCVIAAIRAGSVRGLRAAVVLQHKIDATSFAGRVALVGMLAGAVVHLAIVPTHWGDSRVLAILFVLDAAGLLAASAWLLMGRRHWRLAAVGMLGGTVVGYVLYLLKGWETADPVGLITTGVELAAALALLMPEEGLSPNVSRRWVLWASMPIAAVTILGSAVLAGEPSASAARTGNTQAHASMPGMRASGTSGTARSGSMPSMSDRSSPTSTGSMPTMTGTGSSATMPDMAGTSSPPPTGSMPTMTGTGTSTTMPGMNGAASPTSTGTMPTMTGTGSSTTLPGMGGGSSGGSGGTILSLATTSPAGPITWPLSMGSMGAGMQMVTPSCTATPSSTQQNAAVALVDQTVAAVDRYQNLANARSDGYVPITPTGRPVVHYAKPSFNNDGRILDPNAIESLVYANTPHGAVLVATMYLMADDQVGATPPMPGGCLTEWHIHTNLCFSNSNGTVVGVTSGGACQAGSTNHVSQPMIHVWLAPVPGGPLVVDATDAQVVQAAEQLPTLNPPNPTA